VYPVKIAVCAPVDIFLPSVFSDTVHGYIIPFGKVEVAGSMACCHKVPHKQLDHLVPNEIVNF